MVNLSNVAAISPLNRRSVIAKSAVKSREGRLDTAKAHQNPSR
jgi:hypothetical protein